MKRIPALDGLRGLAIALVLILHFADAPDTVLGHLAGLGWVGVDLFFVLSGFLITGILLDTRGQPGWYRSFVARRALRILPLYYGMLLVMLILPHVTRVGTWTGAAYLAAHPWWYWTHTSNWLIAVDPGATAAGLSPLWSLAIEEQFYFVWPLVVVSLRPATLVRVCVAILIVGPALRLGMVASGAPATWIYAMTPTRLDPLAAGAILAVVERDGGLERFGRHALRTALVAGLAVELIVWAFGTTNPGDPRSLSLLVSAFAILWGAMLVVTLTTEGRWHRAMLSPPLRWLGRYSYALYLIQSPVRAVLMAWGYGPAHIGRLRFALAALPLCLAGSWASWHLWEKHWLALRDRVTPHAPLRGAQPRSNRVAHGGAPLMPGNDA